MLISGVVLTTLLINVFAKKPKECGPLGSTITNNLDRVRRSRIMGGNTVDIKEAPWVVRIDRNGGQECTGTLISKRHVLTVGHCFTEITNKTTKQCAPDQYEYSVCRLTSNNNLPCQKSYKSAIKKIHFLDDYIKSGCIPSYEVVVVELKKEIKDITPICLPIPENGIKRYYLYNNDTYYFGYSPNRGENTQLKYANAGKPQDHTDVTDFFLKTEFRKSTAALYPGDSGGPMIVINDKKAAVLIGVNVNADWDYKTDSPYPHNPQPYMQNSVKVAKLLQLLKDLGIPSLAKWEPWK